MKEHVKSASSADGLLFIKEVAKYFMDFLETDFHKRHTPKRSIKFHSDENLLIGLNLSKHPAFTTVIWKSITRAFDKPVSLAKGAYKTHIPQNLLDLVQLQINKISKKELTEIVTKIHDEIQKAATVYPKEYDRALSAALDSVAHILHQDLVRPFVGNLEKPLENLRLGDENSVYLMEEELTNVLMRLVENKLSAIIKFLLTQTPVNIAKEVASVFDLSEVKSSITDFFQSFQVTDLFSEIQEMDRNRSILDKQELYFYFCDITFNNAKYPIFYLPLAVERQNGSLLLVFDAQVYINKKALEYIVQEYNQQTKKRGNLKTISERILYLAQHRDDLVNVLAGVLSELVGFFDLDNNLELEQSAPQVSKGRLVRISNACYIALFERSDEALVNDYEDILRLIDTDSELGRAFERLIDDFIHKDPKSFNPEVEEEWDATPTTDKLVAVSPIPLNSEQRQILSAVKKDGCTYVTVEGPPGTGKSHTITAIVCDAILKNQSVLVLSDKKEALDVVEDKITETMNRVRHDKKFQNPILRLGRTGNTYSQILSTASVDNIKLHYRAVKKNYERLEENIQRAINSLTEDVDAELLSASELDLNEVLEWHALERYFEAHQTIVDFTEVFSQPDSALRLEEFQQIFRRLQQLDSNRFLKSLGCSIADFRDVQAFQAFLSRCSTLQELVVNIKQTFKEKARSVKVFEEFSDRHLQVLDACLAEYQRLKKWLIGYLLTRSKVLELDRKFGSSFALTHTAPPHEQMDQLLAAQEVYHYACGLKSKLHQNDDFPFDYLKTLHTLLTNEPVLSALQELLNLREDIAYVQEHAPAYSSTLAQAGLRASDFKTYGANGFTQIKDAEFDKLVRFVNLHEKLTGAFGRLPDVRYLDQKQGIEDLVTTQMTYLMDGRLIVFYEHTKATAKALRDIIRGKQRFPREEFAKLKEAFPCILAGIRDYAEYIPLEPAIFNLVIIDEASQVSIAQAFPALLRAKRVLILGDKRQFSNVKAAQARSDTNREYLNRLEHAFKTKVSRDPTKLVKLAKFNIKTSILEFFEFITNYHIQLLKHFRCYREIISYSNRHFYQGSLQVMKIRGKPIDEVLRFSFINHDGKVELHLNTNLLEVEFIISELKKLKEQNATATVGIITPHTDQQKLLIERITKLADKDFFFDKLKLKIMTFDTCQGEERDIIFYSMVASQARDRLWGVFIKDLDNVDAEEEGKIKVQRLNVGFSRAKECMHFVVSKPLEEFQGSIGEALRYYHTVLHDGKREWDVSATDPKSTMEPQVMQWFYQTEFWNKNKEHIEFIPQFELGKYLKQLDPMYNHPQYKVDFLLMYTDAHHREHKIIIEYDGFKEHFRDLDQVTRFNYQQYYSEDDLYREKVLESYGYKLLRINRFNVGKNPVQTLDGRITRIVTGISDSNAVLTGIHDTITGLQNGQMKECPKCKEIRTLSDFQDPSLSSGYGRFCMYCKKASATAVSSRSRPQTLTETGCPRCGSRMVLRHGRYGAFYGCSKFPYCKGTRKV